jgi:hypothetical protein
VSRPVRQALALDTLESITCPFPIVDAEGHAVVVPEIKFREVAHDGEGLKGIPLNLRWAEIL